jgi:hypothetical protein
MKNFHWAVATFLVFVLTNEGRAQYIGWQLNPNKYPATGNNKNEILVAGVITPGKFTPGTLTITIWRANNNNDGTLETTYDLKYTDNKDGTFSFGPTAIDTQSSGVNWNVLATIQLKLSGVEAGKAKTQPATATSK